MLDIMARQVTVIRAEGAKVRVVHDYRNAPIGEQFLEQAIQKSKSHRTSAIERAAVLGLGGFRKNLFHRYRMETGDTQSRVFDTLEEALAWVIA